MKKGGLKYIIRVMLLPSIIGLQLVALIFVLGNNAINLAFPKIAGEVIDQYIATHHLPSWFTAASTGIILGAGLFGFAQATLSGIIAEKVAYELRSILSKKVFQQPYDYVMNKTPAKILTVFMSDVNFLKQILGMVVVGTITIVSLLAGSIFLMYSINPFLTAMVVITVPLLFFIVSRIFGKATKLFKQGQEARDRLNKVIDENIKASMLVRVFVAENTEEEKFSHANEFSKTVSLKITNMFAIIMPIIQFINVIGSLFIVNIGGIAVINGNMSIGSLSAFINYVSLFTIPILILGFATVSIGQAIASIGRINEILEDQPKIIEGEEEWKLFQTLEFRNVSFGIEGKQFLRNVTFTAKRGERIGVIGLNGSGKTLTMMLIPRILDPSIGEIYVNDKPIKSYPLAAVRNHMGIAFQENYIIDASIYENITFGRHISKERVVEAAQTAEVMEFASQYDEKLDFQVGERGSSLSGGQKQRIMIARAIVHPSDILIFDDTTSMLDIATEQKILKNLEDLNPETTLFIVAQRIATMRLCDRVLLFDQGQLIAEGTHDELLKSSTLYQEIEMTQRNYEAYHA